MKSFIGQFGEYPQAGLVEGSGGSLYGTAGSGGVNGFGTIYRLMNAKTFSTIYSFDATEGGDPVDSQVLGSDGNFYGDTLTGAGDGTGSIFSLSYST